MLNKIKTTIYTAYHQPDSFLPEGPLYVPIAVGRKLGGLSRTDSTGENISTSNWLYCELTATYWAYKNDNESDFIGIAHYRRYFDATEGPKLKATNGVISLASRFRYLAKKFNHLYYPRQFQRGGPRAFRKALKGSEDRIGKVLQEGALIAPKPIMLFGSTIRGMFAQAVPVNLIECAVAEAKCPELKAALVNELNGHSLYPCNMFVMNRNLFLDYSRYIFPILGAVKDQLIDTVSEQKRTCFNRTLAYLGEIITSSYIRYLKESQKQNVVEMPILQLTE